ncbi:hypothetical protein, partial [Maricaulis maris]|uniref:hypothetical protein n=1 Tax=Maricaulis maris TaxID=74318 RepID=UPI003B8B0815
MRSLASLWEWQCQFVRIYLNESALDGGGVFYQLIEELTDFIPSLSAPLYQAVVETAASSAFCSSLAAARNSVSTASAFAKEGDKSAVLKEVMEDFALARVQSCIENQVETDDLSAALRNLERFVEELRSDFKAAPFGSDYETDVNTAISLISLHKEILKRAIGLQESATETPAGVEGRDRRLDFASDAHILYREFLCEFERLEVDEAVEALRVFRGILDGDVASARSIAPCVEGEEKDPEAIRRAKFLERLKAAETKAQKISLAEKSAAIESAKLIAAGKLAAIEAGEAEGVETAKSVMAEKLAKANAAVFISLEEIARIEELGREGVGDEKLDDAMSDKLIEHKTEDFAYISNLYRTLGADHSSREYRQVSGLRVLPLSEIMDHADTSSTLRATRWFRRLESPSSAIESLYCDLGESRETFLRFTSAMGESLLEGGLKCSGVDLRNFGGSLERRSGVHYILNAQLGDLIDVPARSSQDMRFAIADCNGRIVFGNLDGGSTVNNLSHWLGLSPSTAKTGEKDAEIRPFALFSTATVNASIEDDALAHSRVETIFLGGQQYQAAIQPYRLPIGVSDPSCELKPSDQPTASEHTTSQKESTQNQTTDNRLTQNQATWFVVGLTPYDKIVRETRNPPFLVVAWTVPLVFLGLLTWPYLTFRFAGSGLNLGRLHLTVTAISLPVGFGLLSLLLFAFYHYQLEQTKVVVEAKAISKSLSAAFSHELDETLEMMVGDASSVDENDQTVSEVSFGQLALLESAENLLSAFDRCRNLLLMNRSKVDATGEGDRWDWRCQWAAESAAADERQTFEQFTRGYQSFEFAWMMDGTPGSPAEGRHVGPHLSLRETAVRRVALGNRGYFQRARNREGWR